MFKKVLIANRGEIALRINRACHELGIQTVAVYSQADADALHVKFADESVCIGPPSAKESYLNMQTILAAAEVTGADAIHPGYGFLAENSEFAKACIASGVSFIGPSPEVIEQMGNKILAKQVAERSGVPILKSLKLTGEKDFSMKDIHGFAEQIGYPVLIKAAMGGGGRGMKRVNQPADLEKSLQLAKAESLAAFGSDEVYIEKYCLQPRHVEFQILGDNKGNVLHLGERDCSIQRRHQKLVEEATCPVMTPELRVKMGAAAVNAAKEVGYTTAGTVEFIVDQEMNFFFLEMNTRIQVEHPVTEMITGVDLLRTQIELAAGQALKFSQKDVQLKGHAIECRITAEDPVTFQPCPGKIGLFHPPMGMGVRIESAACSDYTVSPYYDSMICKLIVYDDSRAEAIQKMRQALSEFVIQGVKTSIPFHIEVMQEERFVSGNYSTAYLDSR